MNNNKCIAFTLIIVVFLCFLLPRQDTYGVEAPLFGNDASFFPNSLKSIENEAFMETAIEVAVFERQLAHIGSYAFWNAQTLKAVYIPPSTVSIGKMAFPMDVVIYGNESSFAQRWALDNNFIFILDDIWKIHSYNERWHVAQLIVLVFALASIDNNNLEYLRKRHIEFKKSMRPQDRIEMYPINYKFP